MKQSQIKNRRGVILAFAILAIFIGSAKMYLDSQFTAIAAVLILIGLWCLGVVFINVFLSRSGAFQKFPFQLIKSIFLILFLGAVLFGINYAVNRWDVRWDVTRAKQHTLMNDTISLLDQLRDKVKLTTLYVGVPPQYLEDLLKEYSIQSKGKVDIEIIDPIDNLGYAAQFGNIISGKQSKVVVQSGSERKDIDFSKGVLTEELLNNAILSVTRKTPRIYFLKGHQEYSVFEEGDTGLSSFVEVLQVNNFQVVELLIGMQGKVPDDCDVLVIAGPKDELTEHEVNAIQDYLQKGGDALIMVENTVITTPDKPLTKEEEEKNPSLNNILNAWGIEIAKDIVVDLANHAGKDVGSPATKSYMAHRAIVKSLDYTFYVRPRSIKMLEDRNPTIKLAPLVLTQSETHSWGETNRTLEVKFDEGVDRDGPVPIAFVLSEPKDENKHSATRMIVFTDADFLTNIYIGAYSNAEMGLNVVYWLSDLDYQPFLGKKDVDISRLDLTSRQKRQVLIVLMFIPVLVLGSGLMVWVRKNN